MKKYIEAKDLPEKEKVYLRKSLGEWQIIRPIKDENGKINKSNLLFGGKNNLIILIIAICIILFTIWAYREDITQYQSLIKRLCDDGIYSDYTLTEFCDKLSDNRIIIDNNTQVFVQGGDK